MFVLVIGGAASGKSEIAETVCEKLCQGQKAYIATMAIRDAESEKRVERHREMRAHKGFDTIESSLCDHANLSIVANYHTTLLECMSNLLANEMFMNQKSGADAVDHICDCVEKINKNVSNLVIVSNDVFGDGTEYDSFTTDYIKALADINRRLAQVADIVIESVYGIPVFLKGDAI